MFYFIRGLDYKMGIWKYTRLGPGVTLILMVNTGRAQFWLRGRGQGGGKHLLIFILLIEHLSLGMRVAFGKAQIKNSTKSPKKFSNVKDPRPLNQEYEDIPYFYPQFKGDRFMCQQYLVSYVSYTMTEICNVFFLKLSKLIYLTFFPPVKKIKKRFLLLLVIFKRLNLLTCALSLIEV